MIDLYTENYKTLMKITEEDINKWEDIPHSWTERINIVQISYYPRQSRGSMKSPLKYQ